MIPNNTRTLEDTGNGDRHAFHWGCSKQKNVASVFILPYTIKHIQMCNKYTRRHEIHAYDLVENTTVAKTASFIILHFHHKPHSDV
jgi:hypothetical protein